MIVMKRIISVMLSFALVLSLSSCGQKPSPAESVAAQSTAAESEAASSDDGLKSLEAIGDIQTDKNLFNVTLTIPADLAGDTTQEELDDKAKEAGYKSATLNEDGSITYVMTKAQHKKLVDEIRTALVDSLKEMVESEDTPNFKAVNVNDSFTEYEILYDGDELGIADSVSVLAFYLYTAVFVAYSGAENVDNIHVKFINANTGELISESNSADLKDADK